VSTCQPCKLQFASLVYMATYATKLQVNKTTRYILVKNAYVQCRRDALCHLEKPT